MRRRARRIQDLMQTVGPLGGIFVVKSQRLPDFDNASAKPGANHGIVTVFGTGPISEFLIVGCQHGWLYRISYDHGGFE
jgi:hypothetical protein